MMKGRKFSNEQKSAVLEELALPGRTVSEVAKNQGVSRSLIYDWIEEAQTQISDETNTMTAANHKFIELSVIDSKSKKNSSLQKASFVFSDCSLMIEGSLCTKKLFRIVEALEETC